MMTSTEAIAAARDRVALVREGGGWTVTLDGRPTTMGAMSYLGALPMYRGELIDLACQIIGVEIEREVGDAVKSAAMFVPAAKSALEAARDQ